MVSRSRPVGPDEGSDASTDVSEIFSDNGSDSDSNSDAELDSEDEDDDEDDGSDDDSFNDEGQLPPEHYLGQAESLDVSQLRQKRYSDGTQEKLDDTRLYWNSVDPVQHWKSITDSDETVRLALPCSEGKAYDLIGDEIAVLEGASLHEVSLSDKAHVRKNLSSATYS